MRTFNLPLEGRGTHGIRPRPAKSPDSRQQSEEVEVSIEQEHCLAPRRPAVSPAALDFAVEGQELLV